MQQVTMGRMHLHHFETGGQRSLGCIDEGLNHIGDFTIVELFGLSVLRIEGNR
ncbi:hypothetical protein D3C84_788520 [compost metagenome]